MIVALILAASLASGPGAMPADGRTRPSHEVDRSLSEADRLKELQADVRAAYARGQIDRKTATEFHYSIERIRRQMIRMGIQVGYRQRVRLRARIDTLYARWALRRGLNADVRSGN